MKNTMTAFLLIVLLIPGLIACTSEEPAQDPSSGQSSSQPSSKTPSKSPAKSPAQSASLTIEPVQSPKEADTGKKDGIETEPPVAIDLRKVYDPSFSNHYLDVIPYPIKKSGEGDSTLSEAERTPYPALTKALSEAAASAAGRRENALKDAARRATYDDEHSYDRADGTPVITRSDSRVVSYIEIDEIVAGDQEDTFYHGVNIDVATGKQLYLTDVLRDPEDVFEKMTGWFDITEDTEFALAYDALYLLADPVNRDAAHYMMLPFDEYPELLLPEYMQAPERFMVDIDSRIETILPETKEKVLFRMGTPDYDPEEYYDTLPWEVYLEDELVYTDEQWNEPSLYLLHTEDGDFIYRQEFGNDISYITTVLTFDGKTVHVSDLMRRAIDPSTPYHPDHFLMTEDEIAFDESDYGMIFTRGFYCLTLKGMPALLGDRFEYRYPESSDEADNDAAASDYILPDSDTRLYTEAEIANLDAVSLRIAINEIYARHGRRFRDEELQAYFDGKPWYNGTLAPEQFDEGVLNEFEKTNLRMMTSFR